MSIAQMMRLKELERLVAELQARVEALEQQIKDQDARRRKAPKRD